MNSVLFKLSLGCVKSGWLKILLSKQIKPSLETSIKHVIKDAETSKIQPSIINIFSAFNYFSPENLKVIIIGQDPYKKSATGLSFANSGKIPPSLRNIYYNLKKHELISDIPETANLEFWARQGILLLNKFLTRNSESSHSVWENFTIELLKYISSPEFKTKNKIFVCLWGKSAQSLKPYISAEVLTWSHPSPANPDNNLKTNPKHFINCNHFEIISNHYSICWNPIIKKANLVVFTDGGCKNNGKINAKASYGVYFPAEFRNKKTSVNNVKLSGKVREINLLSKQKQNPTNQRAELTAVLKAFHYMNRIPAEKIKNIILITDSLQYVNSWLAGRIWKEYEICKDYSGIPNSDLISVISELMKNLANKILNKNLSFLDTRLFYSTRLEIIHQRSHLTKKIKNNLSSRELELVAGNEIADELCSHEL